MDSTCLPRHMFAETENGPKNDDKRFRTHQQESWTGSINCVLIFHFGSVSHNIESAVVASSQLPRLEVNCHYSLDKLDSNLQVRGE